ncbi:hypothetical protein [Halosegnis longus]|uniref:Uncharacterized protein n=1 Tax=Halosegnis longus TaxID=2216012 RepID=A0AAJ4UWX4_9EURY|nr:hypothetical protein Nmn1133_11960 [Salella cibi]
MLTLTTTATREHGRTFVTCRLTNAGEEPRLAALSSPHDAVTPSEHPEGTLRVRVPRARPLARDSRLPHRRTPSR